MTSRHGPVIFLDSISILHRPHGLILGAASGKKSKKSTLKELSPEPVVRVAIWRINREVVHGQYAVRGKAAPMLHVFSSYT